MSNIIRNTSGAKRAVPKVLEQRTVADTKKQRILPTRTTTIDEKKSQLLEMMIRLEDMYHTIRTKLGEEEANVHHQLEQKQKQKELEWQEITKQTYREAEEQGYASGYEAGMQQVHFELSNQKQEMEAMVKGAYNKKEELIQSAEPFLLSLSTAIAKKIMLNEMEQNPETMLSMVKDTLKKVQDRGEVVFQVSAEDYQHMVPMVDELEKQLDVNASLKLIPMSDLEVGSGLVHTPSGSYDISINSQLSEIKKQLLSMFEERKTDEH
ncbi:FliH/SctL family protein [Pseudalkalibacillus hwajinpoensis]|uniref:Flagellar assembly protein FliH/Type III secretion system HrpE domain-containing protein n=1 Tax=Guptibacillus hwajinpoensis TaxID=208199 RepID=A0A4U1MJ19_9BACL|nr:FliH/SctL family protein [Pseudalkalibacillus hwajinpoensis]TKD70545.1 hypothetical protein FBF83_07900 [Pseudalkalibacillus hwajinpoensis]